MVECLASLAGEPELRAASSWPRSWSRPCSSSRPYWPSCASPGSALDLLVLAVVAVAMASDATTGAAFGFVTGLVADLLFDLPVGVSALVYTAVGFAVGTVRVYVTSHRPLPPPGPGLRGQPGLGVVLRPAAAGV